MTGVSDVGNRSRPFHVSGAATALQQSHHACVNGEVHPRVLDLLGVSRMLSSPLHLLLLQQSCTALRLLSSGRATGPTLPLLYRLRAQCDYTTRYTFLRTQLII